MYGRNQKSFDDREFTPTDRIRHFRERTPPWQRSPIANDHRFERHFPEEFIRRSMDRSEARFQRGHSGECFEPTYKLIDEAGRFECPPRNVVDQPRLFENERYISPLPRFQEHMEAAEPPVVERNLSSFVSPADFAKFPREGRYYEATNVNNMNISPRRLLENTTMYPTHQIEDNDKPDPWDTSSVPSSSSQLQPIFGQEKAGNLLPVFDPETSDITVSVFLNLIDKIGEAKSWSANYRKSQFAAKLRGPAKVWYSKANYFLDSWSSVKKQFRNAFPADMDFYSLLTDMMQRVKQSDEDISTYFNYKIVLLKNCNITGRKAVSCLIGGLPDTMAEVKSNALEKNFSTAEELYKYLIDEHVEDEESRTCETSVLGMGPLPRPSPRLLAVKSVNPGAWIRRTDRPYKKRRKNLNKIVSVRIGGISVLMMRREAQEYHDNLKDKVL